MRLLPFRVICVLGLNDGDFPRRDPAAGLSKLTAELGTTQRRHGDRSTREDDRFLFLQLLASAQDVFYLSYLGADPRDGSAREPSVLVGELLDAVAALEEREMSCDIVFLEASDEVLIRRYSENRRRHPIAKLGETTADAIQRERLQLQGVRDRADMIIDTSRLRTSALRNKLRMAFSELSDQQLMDVHVFSFGFKHGMPVEADIMIDVRFLPNPFYDPEMRTMTGLDKKVSDFVLDHPKTQEFWKAWTQLLDTVMPGYIAEGKPQLSIAIGCTGGQHRSVAIAEATARYLEGAQYHVSISHRDLSRANTKA